MKLSKKGFELILHFETGGDVRKYLTAYKDIGGTWTIGIGSTVYEDGQKVKSGDKITEERARQLFNNKISYYENQIKAKIKVSLSQHKFDALVSLCYNLGPSGFNTLISLINTNAGASSLRDQWYRYVNAGGKFVKGLLYRRVSEFTYYSSGTVITNRTALQTIYDSKMIVTDAGVNTISGMAVLTLVGVAYLYLKEN